MTDKPSYLGLLNAIAVGEGQAYDYLGAWAEITDDDGVRDVLRFVAIREGEHALAFEKRIVELGFELRPGDPAKLDELREVATSERSDKEKFEALGLAALADDGPDVFSPMFDNKEIDPITGALLGRYIAEERDSGRRFRACYDQL